ncbi:rhodanese-like domain-containing protein, partial [Candidatus Pelagibacter sp.]|nr:rhodanese-like domain-containing protein [Candidatus Pelagibacter sp.]
LIKILNGGLKKWIIENRQLDNELPKITKSNYKAKEFKNLVKDKNQIDENIIKKEFSLIDVRSIERFNGEVKEPRAGLRSGNIENSTCIPFTYLINTDKTFKGVKEIKEIFNKNLRNLSSNNVVFSCGSGVTACVLALAYSLINDNYLPIIYDGSWSEYGQT